MKSLSFFSLLLAGLFVAGCASHQSDFGAVPGPSGSKAMLPPETSSSTRTAHSNPPPTQPVVTPDTTFTGKIVAYNAVGRFVVISFPVGHAPSMDQTLFLYRGGLKVGQIKVTGPQRDNNIVADLISGNAQTGDEVRGE